MFSVEYNKFSKCCSDAIKNAVFPSANRTRDLTEKSHESLLPLDEIAELLEIGINPSESQQFEILRNFCYSKFRNENPNILRHVAPVYVSSYCTDTCKYCQYSSAKTETNRTRLSLPQIIEEVNEVRKLGNFIIELTLASDPYFTAQRLAEYISEVSCVLKTQTGSGLLLCSTHFPENEYKTFKDAGLWGIVQWDETLDEKSYESWHGNLGTKRNFRERMDTHDFALRAGLQVATGALFGLSDFRFDTLMQIAKARYLGSQYGAKPFVFGTPRVSPGNSLNNKSTPGISDFAYETALMVLKIAEPMIPRWLQTRETLELNSRNAMHNDLYTYRCGEVRPGGYKIHANQNHIKLAGQFPVHEQEKMAFEKSFESQGFRIAYSWI